jgi:hypothetical protein
MLARRIFGSNWLDSFRAIPGEKSQSQCLGLLGQSARNRNETPKTSANVRVFDRKACTSQIADGITSEAAARQLTRNPEETLRKC